MSVPAKMRHVMCVDDLEPLGRSYLPRILWEFISTGVEGNHSREENRRVFEDYWLKPRVLNDVTERSTKRSLLGKEYDVPVGIAPMGASAMFGFEADLNFARAAKTANIPYLMSGSALIPMEKVVAANPDIWFQAYVESSRESMGALADRVARAGIKHLSVTVDVPVAGNRGSNMRAGFNYPITPTVPLAMDALMHPCWLVGTFLRTLRTTGIPHMENLTAERGIPMISYNAPRRVNAREGLNWEDIKWLRDKWQGQFSLKGILSGADAKLAAETGLDGVIVSNHGGRQLDTSVSPLSVLQEVVAEKGNMAVMFDGGIRRGTDIIKALGLGADFVFAGRPFLYGAALGEEAGILHVIEILRSEIYRNLALLGCTDLNDLSSRLVKGRG